MKVIKASHVGLCFGVARAKDMAEQILRDKDAHAAALGPLMHNPQEMARLESLGLVQVESVTQCIGILTMVRAHGISRQEADEAKNLGVELIDATCPHVLTPRKKMEDMGRRGRTVILLGNETHAEVKAQVSYALGPVFVIASELNLPDLPRDTPVGLIAQTTLTQESFMRVCERIGELFDDVEVHNTICSDTQRRQTAAISLASKVDAIVVVGGKNSANTCRLVEICESTGTCTFHVEIPEEVISSEFQGLDVVGLTSGASTPEWLLDAVYSRLKEL